MGDEHRTQRGCEEEGGDPIGSCGPPPGAPGRSSASGPDGRSGDGALEPPLSDSLDVGERELGVTEHQEEGDRPCTSEADRGVVQYTRGLGSHPKIAGAADASAAQRPERQGGVEEMAGSLLDAAKHFRQRELTGRWPVFTSGG